MNSDNNINDVNKKANYSENNVKNSLPLIMATYLSNISFMYLLIIHDNHVSNKASIIEYIAFD